MTCRGLALMDLDAFASNSKHDTSNEVWDFFSFGTLKGVRFEPASQFDELKKMFLGWTMSDKTEMG